MSDPTSAPSPSAFSAAQQFLADYHQSYANAGTHRGAATRVAGRYVRRKVAKSAAKSLISRGLMVKLAIPVAGFCAVMMAVVLMAGSGLQIFQSGEQAEAAAVAACEVDVTQPSADALSDIPGNYLKVYRSAAASYPGLSWAVLAAVGKIESDHGRERYAADTKYGGKKGELVTTPGTGNDYGAAGPMQIGAFPGSPSGDLWASLAPQFGGPDGVWNFHDAIPAAAAHLAADGGQTNIEQALFDYNHAQWYVQEVLDQAAKYEADDQQATDVSATTSPSPTPSATPTVAPPTVFTGACGQDGTYLGDVPEDVQKVLNYAFAQLGKPYVFGATGPDAFDCSGLTLMSYRQAGINLPRTSQEQFDVGVDIPGRQAEPGDLIFFNNLTSEAQPDHVGIVIGPGQYIEAPHTGAFVQISNYTLGQTGLPIMGFRRLIRDDPSDTPSAGPSA